MSTIRQKHTGFTIVELLIVIVVIGILAAITIVAYNGVQNKAYDSAVKSDLSSAAKALGLFNVEKGRYPNSTAELATLNLKFSKQAVQSTNVNINYCSNSSQDKYALLILGRSGIRLYVTSDQSLTEFTGVNLWTGVDHNLKCSQVLAGTSYYAGGYILSSSPNEWQAWTGINN